MTWEPMRPNWFFAFPLDGAFLLDLPAPPKRVRIYHPEDVHLTLAFLGGCGEDGAYRALAVLDEILAAQLPPARTISLGPVGPMGSPRSYTALAASLLDGASEMTALLGALRDPLTQAASGRAEKRRPRPHVTVARPERAATDAERAAGLSWAAALRLGSVSVRADRIALYTWTDVRRPRMFRVVEHRTLQVA